MHIENFDANFDEIYFRNYYCKSEKSWFTKIKVREMKDDTVVTVAKVIKEAVFRTAS